MLFSIVIPAYNAEPFLRRCIDSCLNQKGCVPNYEIIIVNDGSTDGTQAIIDEYVNANLDPNGNGYKSPKVSFISQPNGGLSKARNEGLKKAQGEYVWFVDSDDWIAENALAVLNTVIDGNHPDVMAFRGYDVMAFSKDVRNLSGRNVLKKMGTIGWCPCVPFYCMKRSFLENHSLVFMEGIIHEDCEFTPRMLYFARTVCICSEILYFVFQNPASLNRRKNLEKSFHTLKVLNSLCKFCSTIVKRKDRPLINNIIGTTMNMALKETKGMDKEQIKTFCKSIRKEVAVNMIFSTKIKYQIEGLLLLFFRYKFVVFINNLK